MAWQACDACYADYRNHVLYCGTSPEQNLVCKQKPPVVLAEGALERRLVGLGL